MNRKLWNGHLARRHLLVILDAMIVCGSAMVALFLRYFETPSLQAQLNLTLRHMPWIVACYIAANICGQLYRMLWRYASGSEYVRMGLCSLAAGILTFAINQLLKLGIAKSVLILTCAFVYGFTAVSRYLWRMALSRKAQRVDGDGHARLRRILIVGADRTGVWAALQCKVQRYGVPIAMVGEDASQNGLILQGVPVLGSIADIPRIAKEKQIEDIIIAISGLKGNRMSEIATICTSTRCRVCTISNPREINANGEAKAPVMRRLNIADFLSRDEIKLDMNSISGYLQGRTILVTGGGGSIGSEICRQVMRFSPKRLLIFDIYENCAYELFYELKQLYGSDVPVTILIGSVRDRVRVDQVMERYHPSVVFHAAAHKHVPLMESAPAEAVKNNVFGTRNVMGSAARHGVERFVILSTDKAVNPTNVMGATKRITEMIIQTLGPKTGMKCMAVRFGNVLGSHGSVIPLFESQIKSGGPVTVTHPDITRYFMTIPEAAQLVLQAGGIAQSGSIYVLDMGKPVRIVDLAERLIRFYGYEPGVDMKIEFTGLRPGEKLYEELLMGAESNRMTRTSHDLIFVAPPIPVDEAVFIHQLDELESMSAQGGANIVKLLQETVTTFHPQQDEKKVG